MRYSSRLFLYAPLIVVAALAVAAGLLWQSVAGNLEKSLQHANGHEIAPGVVLRFAREEVGGFPFNVDVVLDHATFEVRTGFGTASWHTERFALHELTFGRAQQIYEAAGTQALEWTDSERDRHRFVFVPGSLQASAISSGGRLVRFDLDINGVGSREITGTRVQLHFRKSPGRDAIDVVLSADDLHLARHLEAGFGPGMQDVSVRGTISPETPWNALFGGRDAWMDALDAWRRSNGAFHLDRLELRWGSVAAKAQGSLALDAAHRLSGNLAIVMTGRPDLARAAPGDALLARALSEVAKDAPPRPLHISANIVSGAVNLAITQHPHTAAAAGRIGALY